MGKSRNFRKTTEQPKAYANESGKTYSENGRQNSIPPPPPTHTRGHMYRIMCIAGAIIGIVFIIVLIKAMKEEII